MQRLEILSLNIHKGLSHFNWRPTLKEIRELVRRTSADIVFLQEVQELLTRGPEAESQLEFLADSVWSHYAYGKNAVYDEGHHGNAILSKYPIRRSNNLDLTQNRFEMRGMLHCELELPEVDFKLHCFSVHLNLLSGARKKQLEVITSAIRSLQTPAPFILAGDFNDWSETASGYLNGSLDAQEAFTAVHGSPAKSYPSVFPILKLDRIYFRGLQVKHAYTLRGPNWLQSSDHLALAAGFDLKGNIA